MEFREALRGVKSDLEGEAYRVEITAKADRTVASAFIRFRGLPHELGLSPQKSQVLSVKVEVDTRPPGGARIQTTLVRRHVTLHLVHHDKASLLAGKLHALLTRRYTKGRDLYDLVWYLADRSWPAPNLPLLEGALAQTGWSGDRPTAESWRGIVARRLDSVDWKAARNDVLPFLERPEEVELLARGHVLALLV